MTTATATISDTSRSLAEHHSRLAPVLPGRELDWLRELRGQAQARFQAQGLPSTRQEIWKYTSLRPLEKLALKPVERPIAGIDRLPRLLPIGQDQHRLVFVNGRFNRELSAVEALPAGVTLTSLAEAIEDAPNLLVDRLGQSESAISPQPLYDLNTAMIQDGLVLHVAAGVRLDWPVEVVSLGVPDDAGEGVPVFHPRNLLVLEAGAKATLLEHHAALGAGESYVTNGVSEIFIGDKAELHHYRLQAESAEAFHFATLHVALGEAAFYDGFCLTSGARLSRNEIQVRLQGEHAHCNVNGAYMLRGQQHCDITTRIDHLVPETSCREVFKGVLEDKARAVFQGKLVVHPDAQHTDGHQLSKALLLSDQAEIDAKPELEIYADDVRCSHGATTGDIDHDALFYLRSRGIPEPHARRMLIEAFLGEAVQEISSEGLCPALMSSVAGWLGTE